MQNSAKICFFRFYSRKAPSLRVLVYSYVIQHPVRGQGYYKGVCVLVSCHCPTPFTNFVWQQGYCHPCPLTVGVLSTLIFILSCCLPCFIVVTCLISVYIKPVNYCHFIVQYFPRFAILVKRKDILEMKKNRFELTTWFTSKGLSRLDMERKLLYIFGMAAMPFPIWFGDSMEGQSLG